MIQVLRIACVSVLAVFVAGDGVAGIRFGLLEMETSWIEKRRDHKPPTTPRLEFVRGWTGAATFTLGDQVLDVEPGNVREITFKVSGSKDNRTSPDEMGYRLCLIDGDVPDGFRWPTKVFLSDVSNGERFLNYFWEVEESTGLNTFSFRVAVVAVDRGGNESATSNIVTVSYDPKSPDRIVNWRVD